MQMVSAEINVPMDQQRLFHDGKQITEGSLQAQSIKDGEIIVCKQKQLSIHDIRGDIAPDQLLNLVAQNPHLQSQFNSVDPELGSALASGNVASVRMVQMARMMAHHKKEYETKQEEKQLFSNPDSSENQAKIEEYIRKQNVEASYETAMEHIPESFARVTMLYIDIEINGSKIKAFVDSGAQSTIISVACAQRCNLMRLVDTRFAGMAKGVGTAKIVGRIHIAQMKIGQTFLPISITVLDSNDVDFLFGLDMLKRHRCVIDLAQEMLIVSDGVERIPFLSEKDLPENARMTTSDDK